MPAPPPPTPPPTTPTPTPDPRTLPGAEACRVAPRPASEVERAVDDAIAGWGTPNPNAVIPSRQDVAERDMVVVDGAFPDVTVIVGGTVVPQGRPPFRPTPEPFVPPPGVAADAETVAGVKRTYRERIACFNAYDFACAAALRTDADFRSLVEGMLNELDPESVRSVLAGPPPEGISAPMEERAAAPEIRDVRVLPDGRVGVVAVLVERFEEGAVERLVYVEFARVGERWLFDGDEVTIEETETPVLDRHR